MTDHPLNGTALALPPEAGHEAPAVQHVADHPFEPRGAWFSTCRHCCLAEAAHVSTTVAAEERT